MRAKWRRKKCPWTSFTSNGPGPGPAIELTAAVNVIGERGGPIEKARKNGGLVGGGGGGKQCELYATQRVLNDERGDIQGSGSLALLLLLPLHWEEGDIDRWQSFSM